MVSFQRIGLRGRGARGLGRLGLAIAATTGIAGCSADIARFDFPAAGFAEGGGTTGAIPTPSEPVYGRANLGAEGSAPLPNTTAAPVTPATESRVDVAALPEPAASGRPVPPLASEPSTARPAYVAPVQSLPENHAATIEVQPGDTLYGLSRRHGVSLNELMRINRLTSPALKPGQRLTLPSSTGAIPSPAVARSPAPAPSQEVAASAPSDWTGSYTVKSGDSLYAIARNYNVKLGDLTRYNGITDARRVRPGTVLRLPGSGTTLAEAAGAPQAAAGPQSPPPAAPITAAPLADPGTAAPPATGPQLTILNARPTTSESTGGSAQIAALDGEKTLSDAPKPGSASVAGSGKLRWPARGRVIAGFGPRPDGTHNDGINIAVPAGTEVHAAEDGVVVYAGDQLKGYGNLILVRHANGIVTAYAHADQMLVKRNDRVSRGQVIAKAGNTGHVDQPQLHFEVRQQERPVDPTSMLE